MLWTRSVLTLALAFGLTAGSARAAEPLFVVDHVNTELIDGVYRLDATMRYELTDKLLDALLNGVTLVIEFEVEIARKRSWWFDAEVASVVQRYALAYHALSRQYVVHNLNTDVQTTYPSLYSALHAMGTVRDFPLVDASLLEPDERYEAHLQARLAVDELPLPLRARGYMNSDWRPASEWYTWRLR